MTGGSQLGAVADRADIGSSASSRYQRACTDPPLGSILVDIAETARPAQLPVPRDRWERALPHTGRSHRNALLPHRRLATEIELAAARCQRRLAPLSATVAERSRGQQTEPARPEPAAARGPRIAAHGLGTTPMDPSPVEAQKTATPATKPSGAVELACSPARAGREVG